MFSGPHLSLFSLFSPLSLKLAPENHIHLGTLEPGSTVHSLGAGPPRLSCISDGSQLRL